jgi:hypothetical protein
MPVGSSRGPEAEIHTASVASLDRRALATESAVALLDAALPGFAARASANPAAFEQFMTSLRSPSFVDELDRMRDEAHSEFNLESTFAVSATGITFGMSLAYVLWMIRSGVLMGSLLSALPAWRVLDPLPVLSHAGGAAHDERDDPDESTDTPVGMPADAADPVRTLRES